jgi:protein SCO1/2
MNNIGRRSLLALLGAAPLAGAVAAQTPRSSSSPVQNISSRERLRQLHFPNVLLTTHEGRKVRFYDDLIKDKIVLINFMYAKCEGVCPGITMNLARVQKLLGDRVGKDIFMYSFTLKPEEDTPGSLAAYAEMHHTKPGWLFLTGGRDDMELLRRKLGFTDPDPVVDAVKSSHIGNVRYGNEPLQRWGACPGLAKASWIAESISWVDWPRTKPETGKGEDK